MAELRQKERGGKWFLDYRDVDGSRFRIDTGTRDKKVADLWLRKVEELTAKARLGIIEKVGRIDADVIAGREKRKQSLALKEYKSMHEDRCRNDLEMSEGTIALNGYCIDSFIGVVGNKRLEELTEDDVRHWKRTLDKENKSKTTLSIYHRQLRAIFNRAVKWGLASSNPFDKVEISKGRQVDEREKNMSYEEVQKLLKTIDASGDVRFATYVRFVLYTACRRNEILFLRYEDINLKMMSVMIRSQKTGKILTLPINKALKRVTDMMDLKQKGYIFQTESTSRGAKKKEQPWHEDFVSAKFKEYIREAGLPDRYTPHCLRHTYATYLLRQGVPVVIVQKLLGHSSPRTTSENYDHSMALHFRAQADLVDFEGEGESTTEKEE